jgi:adenylate cyclase
MLFNDRKRYLAWVYSRYGMLFKRRRQSDGPATETLFYRWSGLAVATLSVGLSLVGFWSLLEQQSYNHLHWAKRSLVGPAQWDERIAIIAIDEASIDHLGRFPWPRDYYADLLDRLKSAQPAAITFDILLPETSEDDSRFAQAIVENANVVLAVGTESLDNFLDVSPVVSEQADGFFLRGDIRSHTDTDGVTRELPLYGDQGVAALSLATLRMYVETMAGTTQAVKSELSRASADTTTANPNARLTVESARGALAGMARDKSGVEGETFNADARDYRAVSVASAASDKSMAGGKSMASDKSMASAEAVSDRDSLAEDSAALESSLSESSVSESSVSESSLSESSLSESSLSESSLSEPSVSESAVPESAVPESAAKSADVKPSWDRPAALAVPPAKHMQTAIVPKGERVWINWPDKIPPDGTPTTPEDLQVYSFVDVLEGRVDVGEFQNKIILIGTTFVGSDPLRTPFQVDPPIGGVHLYAAAIDNLLNHSFLRRPPLWQVLLLLVVLSFVSSFVLSRQGVYRRIAMVLAFPLVWSAIALGAFMGGWWIPVAAPIATLMMSALAIQLHEQQEKQQLMALFSMNVSPGTAELIWRHKGVILHQGELAAQNLTATVLFMDIRGFTGIAESLPSHALLPWLNQYFETMTDCIMKHGGMVDKYIGDAIMAVFGAPLPRTQPAEIQADAIAALHAAIEMHERLTALNRQLETQNLPTIEFGIGIHTGPLIGGTVGNRHRLNYSLFGDTVNIAARLESMTKVLSEESRFKLLISADTVQYTRDYFPLLLFQSVRLRGREAYTDVYTIAAEPAVVDGSTLVDAGLANRKINPVAPVPSVPAAAISAAASASALSAQVSHQASAQIATQMAAQISNQASTQMPNQASTQEKIAS